MLGFIYWLGAVAMVPLFLIAAFLLNRLAIEAAARRRGEPTDSVTIAQLWGEAAPRIWAWLLSFGAAIAPNAAGLAEGISGTLLRTAERAEACPPDFVSGAYINTAASIALITACTTLTSLPTLYRHASMSKSRLTTFATIVFSFFVLMTSYKFTKAANLHQNGTYFPHDLFYFLIIITIAFASLAEIWAANAAIEIRKKRHRACS